MLKTIVDKKSKSYCCNCMFALSVVGASDEVRCGISYYKQPPVQRQVLPLKAYPLVDPNGVCDQWQLTLRLMDA